MKLPNGHQAFIDLKKIDEYCLSDSHDDGKHKSYLFNLLLGIGPGNSSLLVDALRDAAANTDAQMGKNDTYGQRFVIDFQFSGPGGTNMLRSAWIIRSGETVPRLVTCYIL
ncbi:MAG: DUF6883 domain-containing protein [Pirellulales bacterium]